MSLRKTDLDPHTSAFAATQHAVPNTLPTVLLRAYGLARRHITSGRMEQYSSANAQPVEPTESLIVLVARPHNGLLGAPSAALEDILRGRCARACASRNDLSES